VGTENAHKLDEFRRLLGAGAGGGDAGAGGGAGAGGAGGGRPAAIPLRVQGAEALPPGPPVEETGATFAENAALKARAFLARAARLAPSARPRWVVADDSGLCVDALEGAPGVRSARYSGPGATDARNNALLLSRLEEVPDGRRGAEFVCAIACARVEDAGEDVGDGDAAIAFRAEGRCRGEVARAPRGQGGFGYDPLFHVPALGKTFAELSPAEKDAVSHRARALGALKEWLAEDLAREQELAGDAGRPRRG
jgi:XTP/dITP diphosphohydrolase